MTTITVLSLGTVICRISSPQYRCLEGYQVPATDFTSNIQSMYRIGLLIQTIEIGYELPICTKLK